MMKLNKAPLYRNNHSYKFRYNSRSPNTFSDSTLNKKLWTVLQRKFSFFLFVIDQLITRVWHFVELKPSKPLKFHNSQSRAVRSFWKQLLVKVVVNLGFRLLSEGQFYPNVTKVYHILSFSNEHWYLSSFREALIKPSEWRTLLSNSIHQIQLTITCFQKTSELFCKFGSNDTSRIGL